MAYQPLYATVSDNQGYVRGTSSLRGRVNSVRVWVNSWLGEVFSADVRHVEACIPKPQRKGKTREEYRAAKEEFERRKEKETFVSVSIDLTPHENFRVSINGITLPADVVEGLQKLQLYRMDQTVEMLRTLLDSKDETAQERILEMLSEVA